MKKELKPTEHMKEDIIYIELIKIIRTIVISWLLSVVLIVWGFLGFLNQYEYVEETETYIQDGEGYNNINTGVQGDVNNGSEISY